MLVLGSKDNNTARLANIEPLPNKIHVQQHIDNGDFARWGARANKPPKTDPGIQQ